MEYLDKKDLGVYNGFDVTLYFCPEDVPLEDSFDPTVFDIAELYADIERGGSVYFQAVVVASKNGIEIGSDSLGCCHYESYKNFCDIEENGYIQDMIETATDYADATIQGLLTD